MRLVVCLLFCLLMGGCVTSQGVGSKVWHEERLKEIEQSFQNKKITEAEYLSLKNEADKIRTEYVYQRRTYFSYSGHYSKSHHRHYYHKNPHHY